MASCAFPVTEKFAPKLGMKKLEAIDLLESGINDRCEGFSKESYKVPVLYCENCWPNSFTVDNSKQLISIVFFIRRVCGSFTLLNTKESYLFAEDVSGWLKFIQKTV